MQEKRNVIIIGAGPAGLAAAACLRKLGIAHTLFERGEHPAACIDRIDPTMEMLSPARLTRLPGMRQQVSAPYLSFDQFAGELRRYVVQEQLQVQSGVDVRDVSWEANRFTVKVAFADGRSEQFHATHIINATGIISSPVIPPEFTPAATSTKWKHSIDVRTSDVKAPKTLLVIGGGASAAEVLDRWLGVRRDDSLAYLSLRSRLKGFTNPILGIDVHYWIWLHERAPASLFGWRTGRIPEYMNGTRVLPAIRRGIIRCVGKVESYGRDSVVLENGTLCKPDLTVFATGFGYSVQHLRDLFHFDPDGRPIVRRCQSTRTPRLYVLGYKFGRTFASPYIRGIARDARFVARRIAHDS